MTPAGPRTRKRPARAPKKVRPSEINHGNIAPSVDPLGVTCDRAEQTAVITFAGLRRLRFGKDEVRNAAARAYLAALGLVALAEADRQGYALRSRCDLVCDGKAPLELVAFDGSTTEIALDPDAAVRLHEEAFTKARAADFKLDAMPVRLVPQDELVEIVRRSQAKALAGRGRRRGREWVILHARARDRMVARRRSALARPLRPGARLATAPRPHLLRARRELGRAR